jgi:hypothetical protein
VLVDTSPPYPGNADHRLGLAGGDGSSLAMVTYGLQPWSPAVVAAGIPLHVGPSAGLQPFLLQGAPGTTGVATWRLPIPPDPGLRNLPTFWQLFVLESTAPVGVAASQGWEITVR